MSEELRRELGDDIGAAIEAFEYEYGSDTWDYPCYERERDAFAKGYIARRDEE